MPEIRITCTCGRECLIDPGDGATMRCPSCGRIVTVPSKEENPMRRDRLDSYIEAVFELLDEVDGAFPTSGAR
ncbi:MAG: hypothetical protein ACLFUE_11235 [Desulfobacteraceae bacterium]